MSIVYAFGHIALLWKPKRRCRTQFSYSPFSKLAVQKIQWMRQRKEKKRVLKHNEMDHFNLESKKTGENRRNRTFKMTVIARELAVSQTFWQPWAQVIVIQLSFDREWIAENRHFQSIHRSIQGGRVYLSSWVINRVGVVEADRGAEAGPVAIRKATVKGARRSATSLRFRRAWARNASAQRDRMRPISCPQSRHTPNAGNMH